MATLKQLRARDKRLRQLIPELIAVMRCSDPKRQAKARDRIARYVIERGTIASEASARLKPEYVRTGRTAHAVYVRGTECCFCGLLHRHGGVGAGNGMRGPCGDEPGFELLVAPDGTVLYRSSGYYVKDPEGA
jgi:hypothetical protein